MNKRLISLLLVFVFTVQLPFLGYEKGKVYATGAVAGAAGAFSAAGASSVLGPLCIAVLGVAGVKIAADKITDKIEDMTAEEQKEYYNTVAANNKEAIKKLYDDGYFANTSMEEVIGNMLSGDDTACAVSLKKVLEEKEMEEGKDIKTYESGKKDDNGKNKPLVAVSGKLMDLLLDVIGDAVGNMIEDKQQSDDVMPYFPKRKDYGKYEHYLIYEYSGNYYLLEYDREGSLSLQVNKYSQGRDYAFARFPKNYVLKNGLWQLADFQWKIPSTSENGEYEFAGHVNFLFHDVRYYYWFYNNGTREEFSSIPANPYPWPEEETQPATVTEIVNNYFGDEITNFYEDVYNYTTNNSNNNYFTENKYLLPTDPADVAKDIIVPAETTINNTYNNISPDVTVDQDYINNVVIPAIIAGINANLKLNTDVNMGDLTIDNVFDFSGGDPDDETFNKVTFYGLEKKFPFCLPFDIYYFLDALDAKPRAPAFTIVIPLHNFGFEDYPLKIDFSQFDPVFKIVRGCELFLACFGLVFVTKKIIWK